ncbi:MAG: M23 family metallopeptidase [Bacteroidota bacterium]
MFIDLGDLFPNYSYSAKYDDKHGYFIKLQHSVSYETQYSHLKGFVVMKGALIAKGQLIGFVGNSGISTATFTLRSAQGR